MTNNIKRNLKQYMRELSALIPKSYPNRVVFLKDIENHILLHLKEHPDSSWQDILVEFGSPTEVAGSIFTEHENTKYSMTAAPRLRLRFLIIAICVTVVLSIFAYEYYWVHYRMYHTNPTHYIYNGEEVSSEEFSKLTDNK